MEKLALGINNLATSGRPATLVQEKYHRYLRHCEMYPDAERSKDPVRLKFQEHLNEECILYYRLYE